MNEMEEASHMVTNTHGMSENQQPWPRNSKWHRTTESPNKSDLLTSRVTENGSQPPRWPVDPSSKYLIFFPEQKTNHSLDHCRVDDLNWDQDAKSSIIKYFQALHIDASLLFQCV